MYILHPILVKYLRATAVTSHKIGCAITKALSMSLIQESCSDCWLPPLPNSELCRLCTGKKIPYNSIKWVLYHTPSAECKEFRKIIYDDSYYGSALPENCIQCYSFLTSQTKWIDCIRENIRQQSYTKLCRMLSWLPEEKREDILEYVSNVLLLIKDNAEVCKKIINVLVHLFKGKEMWILEELVQRPHLYGFLINKPILLPSYLTEDFYGYFENSDVWMQFWEKMQASTKRRVRFRCMIYKEELMAVAWHPTRVLKWCIDSDFAS